MVNITSLIILAKSGGCAYQWKAQQGKPINPSHYIMCDPCAYKCEAYDPISEYPLMKLLKETIKYEQGTIENKIVGKW